MIYSELWVGYPSFFFLFRILLVLQEGKDAKAGSVVQAHVDGRRDTEALNALSQPRDLVLDDTSDTLYWAESVDGGHVVYTAELEDVKKKVSYLCKEFRIIFYAR